MASVSIQGLSKTYGQGRGAHRALHDLDLELASGEFVALLGPSGSGKTSLLRVIAGLETVDAGVIRIGDEVVARSGLHVPPEKRNVGVVFQSHALWPHLSVFENVAFPLQQAGVRGDALRDRVLAALDAVELGGLESRMPAQLSGGQKQRVSMARALVAEPRVVLFDEPLASLDVALRRGMLRHIASARRLGITMVYVTHNQEEALALADRVAVLHEGRIEQLATPQQLCREPISTRVAQFVGGGNVLAVQVERVHAAQATVHVDLGRGSDIGGLRARAHHADRGVGSGWISVAPADWEPTTAGDPRAIPMIVSAVYFQGNHWALDAHIAGHSELLNLHWPLTESVQAGQTIHARWRDAWLIP